MDTTSAIHSRRSVIGNSDVTSAQERGQAPQISDLAEQSSGYPSNLDMPILNSAAPDPEFHPEFSTACPPRTAKKQQLAIPHLSCAKALGLAAFAELVRSRQCKCLSNTFSRFTLKTCQTTGTSKSLPERQTSSTASLGETSPTEKPGCLSASKDEKTSAQSACFSHTCPYRFNSGCTAASYQIKSSASLFI
ncbi:MAG: hypothetical protein JWM11_4806 [Planctomycetaceae bacterium]|nr:hypothetical protein [Planctomycetaceae bacterium]